MASVDLKVGDQIKGGEVAVTLEVATKGAGKGHEVSAEPLVAPVIEPSPAASTPGVNTELPAKTFSAIEPSPKPAPTAASSRVRPDEGASAAPVHAGPAVRKLAREFGVALSVVPGSGPSQRVLKEDVQQFVKARLSQPQAVEGARAPQKPLPDFTPFGAVTFEPLSRIRRASAKNLQYSWQSIPQVTHFDEADITDLEAFRGGLNQAVDPDAIKISPLSFVVKAVIQALKKYPRFNASIDPALEHWVVKQFFNIGIAVETPNGLVVPNIKRAEVKAIAELAREAAELAELARNKKLLPGQMQGTTFTISSLGGIGGTGFTPIVNSPEVAILGVARMQVLPRYVDGALQPRKILPLALSYDHRAIDGAEAARFMVELCRQLSDVRLLAV